MSENFFFNIEQKSLNLIKIGTQRFSYDHYRLKKFINISRGVHARRIHSVTRNITNFPSGEPWECRKLSFAKTTRGTVGRGAQTLLLRAGKTHDIIRVPAGRIGALHVWQKHCSTESLTSPMSMVEGGYGAILGQTVVEWWWRRQAPLPVSGVALWGRRVGRRGAAPPRRLRPARGSIRDDCTHTKPGV